MDYWRHLTGLWGKKTQRDLGEGMLGMLVQCTKDSYAVLTVGLCASCHGRNAHFISKNSSGCWLLIGHKKCFVLLCPIGEQFLLSSFREVVHDGYCFDHGLSDSCTKEMHAVRKLSVSYKIPIWFQNTVHVCPKTKDAFPKIQAWAYNRYSRFHRSRLE